MPDSSTQSIVVDAAPGHVAAVITDFGAYPEWVGAVKSVEVLETVGDGPDADLARQVRFSLDAGIVRDEYVLRYEYGRDAAGELTRVAWDLVSSNTQKSQRGSYDLAADGERTTVTYTLAVELNIPMLGMFKRKAERVIMDMALKELKKRVENA